jgi:hypothetical protein
MSLIRCHDCGDIIDSDAEPECFWIDGFAGGGFEARRFRQAGGGDAMKTEFAGYMLVMIALTLAMVALS